MQHNQPSRVSIWSRYLLTKGPRGGDRDPPPGRVWAPPASPHPGPCCPRLLPLPTSPRPDLQAQRLHQPVLRELHSNCRFRHSTSARQTSRAGARSREERAWSPASRCRERSELRGALLMFPGLCAQRPGKKDAKTDSSISAPCMTGADIEYARVLGSSICSQRAVSVPKLGTVQT